MKPQSTLKWLAVVGTSTLLALVTASAEPDKDKKDKKDKDQPDRVENKSDKHAGNKADKRADKADEKARKDFDNPRYMALLDRMKSGESMLLMPIDLRIK